MIQKNLIEVTGARCIEILMRSSGFRLSLAAHTFSRMVRLIIRWDVDARIKVSVHMHWLEVHFPGARHLDSAQFGLRSSAEDGSDRIDTQWCAGRLAIHDATPQRIEALRKLRV